MFAVLLIPDFSLHALLRFNPALRGEVVAILTGEGRRARVTAVSAASTAVAPGMTAAQALAECPALQLLNPSLVAERETGALLLSAAWTLSPWVEPTAGGRCTVDLTGANPDNLPSQLRAVRTQLSRQGLPVKMGVGPNALLARYAAHLAAPELWVRDAGAFLKPLPLSVLALTADEERLFTDLGIRTLGALTAFPRAALNNRLGLRGDDLWARAAGEWSAPLQPAPFPARYRAEAEFEEAVETLEPLLFLVRRFCERLALEVGQFGRGTARLTLVLQLDNEKHYRRDFDLPEPTASADIIFAALENHLASLQTDSPIIGLSLEAFPVRRLQTQEGLFDTGLKDAPKFYATLGRIAAIIGAENLGTPRHADSHRQDAVTLSPPAPSVPERHAPAAPAAHGPLLRRLRPPLPATVELTDTRPSFLVSPLARGDVSALRRPVWSNGEWWTPGAFSREEWDVQVGSGLYRLLHAPDGWFIEGIYD
jgi:protein ImuB